MADHKEEQIIQAVAAVVSNLTTSGVNMKRGRYYAWPEDVRRALELFGGSDEPVSGSARNSVFTDSWVTVNFHAVAKTAADQLETELSKIRSETHVALYDAFPFGLGFLIQIEELPAGEPEIDGGASEPVGRRQFSYRIQYRRNTNNPTT